MRDSEPHELGLLSSFPQWVTLWIRWVVGRNQLSLLLRTSVSSVVQSRPIRAVGLKRVQRDLTG